jgi:hypothetical protein
LNDSSPNLWNVLSSIRYRRVVRIVPLPHLLQLEVGNALAVLPPPSLHGLALSLAAMALRLARLNLTTPYLHHLLAAQAAVAEERA